MTDAERLLRRIYAAFNARDIASVLGGMHPDVDWPNGMEGGRVRGHDAVRGYWTRQWQIIDPSVEPRHIATTRDGRVDVEVHQVVRDLAGRIVKDEIVHHVYAFEAGLVTSMEIETRPF
jgi:ketosteroid isomerase-like protein